MANDSVVYRKKNRYLIVPYLLFGTLWYLICYLLFALAVNESEIGITHPLVYKVANNISLNVANIAIDCLDSESFTLSSANLKLNRA